MPHHSALLGPLDTPPLLLASNPRRRGGGGALHRPNPINICELPPPPRHAPTQTTDTSPDMDSGNDPPPPPFLAPPSRSPTPITCSSVSSSSPPSSLPELSSFTRSPSFSLAAGVEPPPKLSPSSSGTELLQSKEHLHVFRDKPLFSSPPSSSSLPSFPGLRRSAAFGASAPSPADHKIASFRELSWPGELKIGSSFQTEPAIAAAPPSASSMTGKGQAGYQACSLLHGLETHLSSSSSSSSPRSPSQLPPRPGAHSSAVDAGAAEDSEVPRPLEALQTVPIPPFLSKTYDFVDDASLDPVVSWGPNGESFVVWDAVEFSRTVLPRHFKHNNFSSFVRQLNTYVGILGSTPDMVLVVCFLRGHKHLLRHIHRRRSSHVQQIGSYVGSSMELGGFGVEVEVEKMRKDKNLLTQEVVKLQKEHVTMIRQLETVKQRMQSAELKQKRLVSFLARALQNPAFLNHLRQEKAQRKIAPSRITRKYLKHPKSNDSESVLLCERQLVKHRQTVDGVSSCANQVMEANADGVSSSANQVTETSVPYQLIDHLFQEVADKLDVNEFTQESVETGEGVPAFMDASDSLLKVESIMVSPTDTRSAPAEYLVSFPEAAPEEEKLFLNAVSEGNEDPILPRESWDMKFMDGTNLLDPADDVWDTLFDEDTKEAGSSMSWYVGGAKGGDLEIDALAGVESAFQLGHEDQVGFPSKEPLKSIDAYDSV